jgi:hypothetical protein
LVVIVVETIYNKRRREKIRENYMGESYRSRQQGVIKVVLYELFSIVFLIGVILLAVKH